MGHCKCITMMLGSNASDIDQVREIQSLRSHCSTDRDRPSVVTSADTYINNAPVPGGLYDPRMESCYDAATCHNDNRTCSWTSGHRTRCPMLQRYLRRHGPKPLRCICINCSTPSSTTTASSKRKANLAIQPGREGMSQGEELPHLWR
jgi:hypothetical protein